MLLYLLDLLKKNTESKNPRVAEAKNGEIILLPNRVACNGKKSKFLKQ